MIMGGIGGIYKVNMTLATFDCTCKSSLDDINNNVTIMSISSSYA